MHVTDGRHGEIRNDFFAQRPNLLLPRMLALPTGDHGARALRSPQGVVTLVGLAVPTTLLATIILLPQIGQ